MANYGNFNFNKKRKGRKFIIAVVCIAAVLLAVIFYIGITAGSGRDENISSAVAENTQLKLQIGELNDKIEKMQTKIDDLNAQLDARPTIAPTPYTPQGGVAAEASPTPFPKETISPRGGIR